MACITSKRGQMDNVITYEHYCDQTSDMVNIDPKEITLGSVCIVIHGTAGLQIYMADSNKNWNLLSGATSNNQGGEG